MSVFNKKLLTYLLTYNKINVMMMISENTPVPPPKFTPLCYGKEPKSVYLDAFVNLDLSFSPS